MRKEKQLLLDELKGLIDGAEGFLLAEYKNLTAKAAHDLRGALKDAEGEFEVVRKRVLVKAAEAAGISLEEVELTGHIGLVVAKGDPVAATKVVFKFGKDNGDALTVLAGKVNGDLYSAADMEKLSKLPDLQTLRAQFVGLLQAPMAQTVGVMQSLLVSILHCLEQKAKKEESST